MLINQNISTYSVELFLHIRMNCYYNLHLDHPRHNFVNIVFKVTLKLLSPIIIIDDYMNL